MEKKIKLCLVGGEDAHKRIELSNYLLQYGFEITILGTKDYDYPDHIQFIKYNLNRKLNLFSDISSIFQYRKIFKEHKFDIVQTFDTKPAFLVPLASFGQPHKVVRTITGLGKLFVSKGLSTRIAQSVYVFLHTLARKRVFCTTFQNLDDRNFFLEKALVTENNHSMIYGSGIDLKNIKEKAARSRSPFTAICVSRLVYAKGIIQYLEAAKMCADKGFGFKFLLVGPLEENSEKLNEKILNQYAPYVEWLGKRSDVPDLLLGSDVFVLPTFYREGFARVLLEASAYGLPLVTTDVPGVTDIARHMKEGLIVKPKDSEALAEAIIALYENETLADELSKNALLNVQNYSMEVVSKAYSDLYQKAYEN